MDVDIHFSEWAFLARTDPEVFERRRTQYIGRFLDDAGRHRPQLEALQVKIDAERQRASSVGEALLAISALMCDSLSELAGEMSSLCTDLNSLEPSFAAASEIARRSTKKSASRPIPLEALGDCRSGTAN